VLKSNHKTSKKHSKDAAKEIGTDLAVGALDQIPLLGTLAKGLVRLYSARQNDKFREFALRIIEGGKVREDFFERIEGKERDAFFVIFEKVMADAESGKVRHYAATYNFLAKKNIFQNKGLADYIITTISTLTVHDIELVGEIVTAWEQLHTDEKMKEYFRHLLKRQGDNIGFRWLRRSSVQKLVSCGMLASLQEDCPLWTTEQFDIIATVLFGFNLGKSREQRDRKI
jgi:hypothetical protein